MPKLPSFRNTAEESISRQLVAQAVYDEVVWSIDSCKRPSKKFLWHVICMMWQTLMSSLR